MTLSGWILLWTLGVSVAADPVREVPHLRDLHAQQAELDTLLSRSESLSIATRRVQNQHVLALGNSYASCRKKDAAELIYRAMLLGSAHRDATQSARMSLARLQALVAAPTVEPLLTETDHAALAQGQERLERQVRTAGVLGAWQQRHAGGWAGWCRVSLRPHPGFPAPLAEQPDGAVAILGVGDGFLCPMGVSTSEIIAVAPDGQACFDAARTCSCEPEPVQTAAVLGP